MRVRIAPRPRTRGRSQSRIHWDKLGRVVLVIVLFVILVSYVNPLVNFVDAWRDARAERTELADQQAENRRLRARAATLAAPDAEEEAARKLGLVAAGERPYLIRGPGRN